MEIEKQVLEMFSKVGFAFPVSFSCGNTQEANKWCLENFGKSSAMLFVDSDLPNPVFFFSNEEYAVLFALRW